MALKDPTAVAAARFGDDEAVICGDVSWSFRELDDRVGRLAGLLAGAGITSDDRLAILAGNSLSWIDATFASIRLGSARSYLNERLAPVELQRIIDDLDPKGIVVAEHLADQLANMDTNGAYVVVAGPENERLLQATDPLPAERVTPKDRIEYIRYTSGTTGLPKGVLHTAMARWVWTMAVIAETGMTRGEVVMHTTSLNFAAWGMVFPALDIGARQVIVPQFDPATVLDLMSEYRVAHTLMVPTMIADILNTADATDGHRDFSALRSIIYGASPIRPADLSRALDLFGSVLVGSYGMSEFNCVTLLPRDDHRPDEPRLNSVGRPHLMSDVRITNTDGNPVPAGEVGTIEITGPQQAAGYWQRPELTADLFTADGWLRTSDLGYLDDLGYLYVVDRKSDLIITGGFNVYPSEVERVLIDHPAVEDVVVLGVPDERWGERIAAVVKVHPETTLDAEALDAWCRPQLASYKLPRLFEFVDEPLPRTSNGKHQRNLLRQTLTRRVAPPKDSQVEK